MQGLLAEADMAPDSLFCSSAFQKDLHAFLHAQVPIPLVFTSQYALWHLRTNEDGQRKAQPGALSSMLCCPLCSLDWLGKSVMLLQVEEWRKGPQAHGPAHGCPGHGHAGDGRHGAEPHACAAAGVCVPVPAAL